MYICQIQQSIAVELGSYKVKDFLFKLHVCVFNCRLAIIQLAHNDVNISFYVCFAKVNFVEWKQRVLNLFFLDLEKRLAVEKQKTAEIEKERLDVTKTFSSEPEFKWWALLSDFFNYVTLNITDIELTIHGVGCLHMMFISINILKGNCLPAPCLPPIPTALIISTCGDNTTTVVILVTHPHKIFVAPTCKALR